MKPAIHKILVAAVCGIVLTLSGCGSSPSPSGSSGNGGTGGSPSPSTSIFVGQTSTTPGTNSITGQSILQFAANSNGSVSPESTLNLPTSFLVGRVTTDASGQVYVPGLLTPGLTNEILIYSAGSTGGATPTRTITGGHYNTPSGSFAQVSWLYVDSAGLLYVADYSGDLAIFSANASGAATPNRYLSGSLTQLTSPGGLDGLAVDGSGYLYVSVYSSTTGSILVFAPGATGNVAPVRTITAAGAVPLGSPRGLALDAAGDLYAINYNSVNGDTIVEFAPGASGAAIPLKTIAGTSTGFATLNGLCVDNAGNIYVLNETISGNTVTSFGMDVFGPSATGNVPPTSQFTSTSWTNPEIEFGLK
jgi:hypothetical protein